MKKLNLKGIHIEITRRCNLACEHCLKGDAQNVDISNKVIDNLLDQVETIDMLLLFGGEPTLHIDAIEYIINKIIKNNIIVKDFKLTTNGIVKDERLFNSLNKYADYKKSTMIHPLADTKNHCTVSISDDIFHQQQTDSKANYRYYKEKLKGYDLLLLHTGNLPLRIGRAEKLDYSVAGIVLDHNSIEFEIKHKKSFWRNKQIMINSEFLVTATGKVIADGCVSTYEADDKAIHVVDLSKKRNLFKHILKYNKLATMHEKKELKQYSAKELIDKLSKNPHFGLDAINQVYCTRE